ncbi:MAG: peptidylprolyl isomerase [Bauldia sp.]|uniref:peptidylprolyl isomerase n=1 Tax=Bauldia sp. TaxID=2575872 RepID=UPI001D576A01|nr:peptidylprolyl isomerase [Bauldia sp.]MCB1494359.1 peptidylprolyl isomerase [Bauldia sp.]
MNVLPRQKQASRGPTIVSVNGSVIPNSDIVREIQYHPAATPTESWRLAAEAMVLRVLLLDEARREGIVASPLADDRGRRETEDEALIRVLLEQAVHIPSPTEAELRRYYDANVAKFRAAELVEARHILVAARADDAAGYAAAQERAEALAETLATEPDRFAELARDYSDCASSGEGGFLGQLTPRETTPEFAAAIAGMNDGETTRHPVKTRYGFHLIRLERRIAARTLPFEAVAGRIAEYLTERAERTATAQYMARLVERADITGITMAGADSRRVH